jgi:uncharacterized membrane protein YsdA (DUF1294 family)
MGAMDQETDWDRLFKAARQAHESGKLNQALELYAAVSRQDPYYPGLEGAIRALEAQMARSTGSNQTAAGSARPLHLASDGAGCVIPVLLYGLIAFVPPLALTWFIVSAKGWDWLFTWLIAHNVMTFLVYGYDKLIAPSGVVRVPELILLLEVLTGAFVGAPLACELFRHKTQKLPFRQKLWIAEIISVAWVAVYYALLALSGYSWSL